MTNHEKLFTPLKNVTLSPEQRSHMRAELSAYADFHAVPAHSPLQRVRAFAGKFSYALAALFLIVAGGSVTYAAHNALPGNPLYPIKLSVLEPIEEVITPHQTPADWSMVLVQRRLNEAELVTNTIDHSTTTEVQAAVEVAKATRVVETHLDALPAQKKEEQMVSFAEKVSPHEVTLSHLAAVASTTSSIHKDKEEKEVSTASTLDKLLTETRARIGRDASATTTPERTREQQKKED